ncbi:MAG: HAMP domain-containing histidine kinase [Alphaproteobacteria bacterium]|nr:HAMP domain-containing histidine kinase [Alphaproteobacteria bacterium]
MPSTPAPVDLQVGPDVTRQYVHDELAELLRRGVGVRVWLTPLLVAFAGIVCLLDPTPWRLTLMGVTGASGLLLASSSAAWVRRHGLPEQAVERNAAAMALFQGVMVIGTGGMRSPLLPILAPMAVMSGLVLERWTATARVVGIQIALLAFATAGELSGWLPPLALNRAAPTLSWGTHDPWEVVVLTIVVVVGSTLGRTIRHRFEHMVDQALRARADQLQTWQAWSHDLEVLGAEIAHELKNPLASVKGLAALVARDLPEGRAAERLAVLRGETDRMEEILESFLTWSRPLSPLTLSSVVPGELLARVAELHEGLARARGVTLSVHGAGPAVRADRRKLTQVLVNLVQNALAVAPAGSEVALSAAPEDDGIRLDVGDRGPGVPEALADRVFAPGVTSRPDGSGLGLTISLAIVRQHGGRLDLRARDGGGTVARVWVPTSGPALPDAAP